MTLRSGHELPYQFVGRLFSHGWQQLSSRPAVEVGIGLVVGLAASLDAELVVSGIMILAAAALAIAGRFQTRFRLPVILLVGVVAGIMLGIPQSIISRNQIALAKPGSGVVDGVVLAEPSATARSTQFTIGVRTPGCGLSTGMRLRVSVFGSSHISVYPGQVIRCHLTWYRAAKTGYDRWLWLRGTYLKARLESGEIEVVTENPIRRHLSQMRRQCLDGLDGVLSRSSRGVVKGIALGDTSDLNVTEKRALADTGVIHILSPSGLHVSIVFGFMWITIGLITRSRSVRIVFSILAVWLYALICGAEAPAVRSAIMCSVAGLAQWSHRDRDALSACAIAALVILAIQPISLQDPSFQMSFVMVSFVLMISSVMARHRYIADFLPRMKRRLVDLFIAGVLCTMAAAPLSAFYFERVSVISPVTNIAISAPVAVITCVAPLAGRVSNTGISGSGGSLSGGILAFCAAWIDHAVNICHSFPVNSLRMRAPSATMLIVYYICYLALLILFKSRRDRVRAVAA
ncbi:MAG: ComEC/Rec2 family competence protein [Armatimonadota bacterium]